METQDELFPIAPDHPLAAYHKRLQAMLQVHHPVARTTFYNFSSVASDIARSILERAPEDRTGYVHAACERALFIFERHPATDYQNRTAQDGLCLSAVVAYLLKSALPFDEVGYERLVRDCFAMNKAMSSAGYGGWTIYVVEQLRPFEKNAELMQRWRPLLCELRQALSPAYSPNYGDFEWSPNPRMQHLAELLGTLQPGPLERGDAWAEAALSDLEDNPKRNAWLQLLAHARDCKPAKPTEKWLKRAEQLTNEIGRDEVWERLRAWMPLFGRDDGYWFADREEHNDGFFKGLVWMASRGGEELLSPLGATLLGACKARGRAGVRSQKVANACLWALGRADSPHAVAAMLRARTRVKHGGILKQIQRAIDELASRLNVSAQELEELSVPDFGLQSGVVSREFGSSRAEVSLQSGDVVWAWTSDGKTVKAPPANVKRDFASELKEFKAQIAELEKTLGAQKERLDVLLRESKSWPLEMWRTRYLEHPLMSLLARRLVWRVENVDFVPQEDGFVNAAGETVSVPKNAQVSLWHPLFSSPEEVLAWRRFFEERGLRQPFKQAHREVYLLTDAERRTHTYSNRFASHVLKQHQFNSLCGSRGWKNTLRLMVDDQYPPATKLWTGHNLRAEFWIEGIGEHYGTDTNETGTYLRVSTDQVRFYPLEAAPNFAHAGGGGYSHNYRDAPLEALPLEEIPPLVFSETMRDVDLFVGVASVGADPTWQDGGPQGHFRSYWQEFATAELTESAKTRADVLSRLLPRLKIREVAQLDGRFLRVQGKKRAYKIHLGSGNILMEPNDQYLCIVPSRDEASGVFLPFEGDRTLAVILSKAFLLAADERITDSSITRQIAV